MKRNNETALMLEVLDALLATGKCLMWRNQTGGAKTRTGSFIKFGLGLGGPDLVGATIGDGVMTCFEIKTPAGRLSKAQQCWHFAAKRAGIRVFVANTVEQAIAALDSVTTDPVAASLVAT
jgi:hypothetical protein